MSKSTFRWGILFLQAILFALALFLFILVAAFSWRFFLDQVFPADFSRQALQQIYSEPTVLYDQSGEEIAVLGVSPHSRYSSYGEWPDYLSKAVVAIEDPDFYRHGGVNWLSLWLLAKGKVFKGEKTSGVSTINQQLVRNVFLNDEKGLWRKIKEVALSLRLEEVLTKSEILERYLNVTYFGSNFYGIRAASRGFFSKEPKNLTLGEAAMLAGLIDAPNRYNPLLNPGLAFKRRNLVLSLMRKQGFISREEEEKTRRESLNLKPARPPLTSAPYFVDYVREELLKKFGPDLVYKGGLQVQTSLNQRAQALADKALKEVLNKKSDPAGALIAIESGSGYIRALTATTDYQSFPFNLAVKGRRQPGSAFKPFVLAAALEEGVKLEAVFPAAPVTFALRNGEEWKVDNFEGEFPQGSLNLREATVHSVNAVYARLIMKIGAEKVASLAQRLGIKEVESNPAIALGGLKKGVTLLEMVRAYSVFANDGYYVEPQAIVRVKDKQGKLLYESAVEEVEKLNPIVAETVTSVLKEVVLRGTGRAANVGREAAGKTGTSQNFRDAWFIGYTPEVVAGVWVGYPLPKPMTKVRGRKIAGGTFPAQIWGKFIFSYLKGLPASTFQESEGRYVTICADSGLRATPFCPRKITLFLEKALIPQKYCSIHSK